jgi:hypothetical protein
MRHQRATAVIACAFMLTAVAACGDDDDAGASEEFQAFCDAELAVEAATSGGDPAAIEAAFTAISEAAPSDAADIVERTIAAANEFLASQGPPTPEFNAVYGELIGVVKDECGFEEVEAEAADFKFTGIDDEVASGPTVITFSNVGSEFHEMAILRRNEGVDQPVEELLMLDQEEAQSMVTQAGGAFAAPGTTGYTVVDLAPGKYIVACFVPTGMNQAAFDEMMSGGAEPDGAPHAMNGMYTEFEVKA